MGNTESMKTVKYLLLWYIIVRRTPWVLIVNWPEGGGGSAGQLCGLRTELPPTVYLSRLKDITVTAMNIKAKDELSLFFLFFGTYLSYLFIS